MLVVLLVLLVAVPLAELAVIIGVGHWIGVWPTLALLLAVSLSGAWLVKRQGTSAWRRIRSEIRAGQVPGGAVVDGALVLLAGALLLVPGFLTDVVGLVLLVRPVRDLIRRLGRQRVTRRIRVIDASSRDVEIRPELNPSGGAARVQPGSRSGG